MDLTSFQADLSDILFSIVELAHTRLSRIIDIRSERHIGLNLSEFLDVYTETWDFVIQTETICRRMVVGLRGTIVSQASIHFIYIMYLFLISLHRPRHFCKHLMYEESNYWPKS